MMSGGTTVISYFDGTGPIYVKGCGYIADLAFCVKCLRGDFYQHAVGDGWSIAHGVEAHFNGARVPVSVSGLCWRCFREERAASSGETP